MTATQVPALRSDDLRTRWHAIWRGPEIDGRHPNGHSFGADLSQECCNHLFAMTPSGNKSTEADLHHTAEIEVTLGAAGGGVKVEDESDAAQTLAIAKLTVAAGGEGVTWTKVSGSGKTVEVTEDGIDFTSLGLLLLAR